MRAGQQVDLTRQLYGQALATVGVRPAAMLSQANRRLASVARPAIKALQSAAAANPKAADFRAHVDVMQVRSLLREALGPMGQAVGAAALVGQVAARGSGIEYGMGALQLAGIKQASRPAITTIAAITAFVGSMAFQSALAAFAGWHADKAADLLDQAMSKGADPVRAANLVQQYVLQVPYVDAQRISNTAVLYSFRRAAIGSFQANSDVVAQWMWSSAKDARTCLSCIAMDGTLHGLDEQLNDHDNGRCCPVPVTQGAGWIDSYQTGAEWFDGLAASTQQSMMSGVAYTAWSDGKVSLADFVGTYDSPIYGEMRRERSMREIAP